MSKIRAEVTISGRVQGVWFRQSTCDVARQNHLTGWCRNNPEGTVTAIFEGETVAVESVIEWCKRGPKLAKVTDIAIKRSPARGEFSSFEIV